MYQVRTITLYKFLTSCYLPKGRGNQRSKKANGELITELRGYLYKHFSNNNNHSPGNTNHGKGTDCYIGSTSMLNVFSTRDEVLLG